jgi:CP family cyanate transporter-like MFS transporter
VVKKRFPDRPGAVTGAYVASLSVGAAAAALAVVPLADALGGWRWAFAVMALPTAVGLPVWMGVSRAPPLLRRGGDGGGEDGVPMPRLKVSRLAFRLAVIFGCQSICFISVVSWAGTLYRDEGWSSGTAAVGTALVPLLTIPAALIAPGATDGRDRRPLLVAMTVVMCAGMFGLAFAPTAAAWVWLTAVGIGSGALFPLALTLPLDLGRSQGEVVALSAWTLGLGYLLAATGPVIVGALRDATGGFAVPMAIVGVIGLGSGIAAVTPALRPRRG